MEHNGEFFVALGESIEGKKPSEKFYKKFYKKLWKIMNEFDKKS
ncbi:hypothetical protein [Dysgonomonas mossii]|nr:hypothetical protein [Dysgonomonas mossii]